MFKRRRSETEPSSARVNNVLPASRQTAEQGTAPAAPARPAAQPAAAANAGPARAPAAAATAAAVATPAAPPQESAEAGADASAQGSPAEYAAAAKAQNPNDPAPQRVRAIVEPVVEARINPGRARRMTRGQLAGEIKDIVNEVLPHTGIELNLIEHRDLVTLLINNILGQTSKTAIAAVAAALLPDPDLQPAGAGAANAPAADWNVDTGRSRPRDQQPEWQADTRGPATPGQMQQKIEAEWSRTPMPAPGSPAPKSPPADSSPGDAATTASADISAPVSDDVPTPNSAADSLQPGYSASGPSKPAPSRPSAGGRSPETAETVEAAKRQVQPLLMDRIDVRAAIQLPRGELARQVGEIASEILAEKKIRLNQAEHRDLVTKLLNDMLGLGPLEPLLADDTVTDIMVNGPHQVYVERGGKLQLSDVTFRDDAHVMNVATRIVTKIGRRVDESSPLVDARLEDGSRVNIIIPPLAIDGPSISIRKFSKKSITLDIMARQHNISEAMATVLKIASRSRLNIIISGGTGSGKTTLLNACSQLIDHGERIVTIEDAAELQLQQPHVVRLETRPANLEGHGEISMRDLVKNALRMRPDRIILGEVRGFEALDMLQAMNTGHEGSMSTVHANRPREALTRLENMVGMGSVNLPAQAVRTQIASAVDVIVQISRMRDGIRRVTSITEVVGMEGDVITTQELFAFKFEGENADGSLRGSFSSTGLRPAFTEKAEYFGLHRALMGAIG